jgi:archaellum biogenesis ATPase FlaH
LVSIYRFDLKGDELHLKFGGGLPRKGFVLIEGQNGIGKSILAQRISYGVHENENSVTYISTELNLVEFLNQMNSLNYDIKQGIISKTYKFVTLFPVMQDIRFRPNLIKKLISSKPLFESDVIIFDTLSELLMAEESELKDSYTLLSFFKKLASQDKLIVFCVDPNVAKGKFFDMLRSTSDVYFNMVEKELYGNILKVIKVERFNSAAGDVAKEVPFNVRAGIGIVPDISG